MTLILLRLSNGSRVLDRPRDFRSYDGRGASASLLLAIDRLRDTRGDRALVLNKMALAQVRREQAREREAAG
jgi:hypothetical protein